MRDDGDRVCQTENLDGARSEVECQVSRKLGAERRNIRVARLVRPQGSATQMFRLNVAGKARPQVRLS